MPGKAANSSTKHPRSRASIISHWFFCWELPFFYKGYKKQITEDDLYGPLKAHKSNILGDKLEDAWLRETQASSEPSLWRTLTKVFGLEFLMYGFLLIPIELTRLCQPILIGRLVGYYVPNQSNISKDEAYAYSAAIILASFLYVLLGHSYGLGLAHLGMKIRIACTSLIYRKSLKISQAALAGSTIGHVVNLLSNDVGRFDYAVRNTHFLWMGPLETLVILGVLYWMLGPTAVIGIGLLLAFVPFQMLMSRKISEYVMRTAVKTDRRVHLMNEIIGGIKIIKMYTWEKPFAKLVEAARKLEMNQVRVYAYLRGFSKICPIFLCRTALYFCILAYVLSGGTLNPEYVYVLTSFYETIRLGFVIFFPFGLVGLGEMLTTVRRISEFLLEEEVTTGTTPNSGGIILEGVTVKRDHDVLSDASLELKPGQLIAIVGRVGSGKSTILQTILGEVPLHRGKVHIGGTISYAPQEPWMFNGSIRDNIIFGENFDRSRYSEVVRVCALEYDFSVLPFGDQSLVGERGVLLSGGQKSRINLARAIYKDADYYLLDDPLSAVDAHVAKILFENCINGFLKNKARLLVTHQVQFLGGVDSVYVVEDGKLVRSDNDGLKILETEAEGEEIAVEEDKPLEVKESQQEGVVSSRIYRDYFNAGGSSFMCAVVLLLHVVVQIIGNGTDYFLSFWVNLEQDDPKTRVLDSHNCLYIYTGLIILLILVANFCSFQFFRFCVNASTNLHNWMFSSIVHSPMRFFNVNPSGRILNRFSRDMGLIDQNLPFALSDTIEVALTVVAITTVISIINPWILIPTIVMFVLFFYYRIIFLKSSRNLKRIEGKTRSPIYNHASTSLQGLATIRALGAQKKLKHDFDTHQDLHSSSFYMFIACDSAFGFWLDITCVIYLALVTLSFLFIGTENYGANVGLSITHSVMMTGLLQWGMKQSSELENEMTSVERVVEYTKLEPEIDNGTTIVPKPWPTNAQIQFSSVSLRYSLDDPYILKNLSFVIQPKEKIGIVGRTGAGKSSLVSVFFRLAHTDGDILIDGVNTKTIPLESLRSKISIIPQEPVLFSDSIRYNLSPFDDHSDSQLWAALEEVQMKTYVAELPGGLSSKVSEGGANFSVGQRQLLCLARAVLKMNKILILDEATANVDLETDGLIQDTIRRKFKDCTVLTIAHRLGTVMDSDRIMVMDDGGVVEFDRPERLLRNPEGVFYKLLDQKDK